MSDYYKIGKDWDCDDIQWDPITNPLCFFPWLAVGWAEYEWQQAYNVSDLLNSRYVVFPIYITQKNIEREPALGLQILLLVFSVAKRL